MIARIPSKSGAFSEAVVIDEAGARWIHVSGQIGRDEAGDVPPDFEEQARFCFARIRQCVEQCGGSMSEIVRITAFLTSLDDYPAYSRARSTAFGSILPSSSTVQVAGLLANAALEVEATAFVGSPKA